MKKVLLAFAVLALLVSCARAEDNKKNAPITVQDLTPIETIMEDGTWHVTLYKDHTQEQTDHFTGFNFKFDADGTLIATKDALIYTGAWSVTNTNTSDESPASSIDFNIFFNAPDNFADITDDWDIVTQTTTTMVMQDGTGSSLDNITFEKN